MTGPWFQFSGHGRFDVGADALIRERGEQAIGGLCPKREKRPIDIWGPGQQGAKGRRFPIIYWCGSGLGIVVRPEKFTRLIYQYSIDPLGKPGPFAPGIWDGSTPVEAGQCSWSLTEAWGRVRRIDMGIWMPGEGRWERAFEAARDWNAEMFYGNDPFAGLGRDINKAPEWLLSGA